MSSFKLYTERTRNNPLECWSSFECSDLQIGTDTFFAGLLAGVEQIETFCKSLMSIKIDQPAGLYQ